MEKKMEMVRIDRQVFNRVLDLIINLKEIARIYHADNYKDLEEALEVYNEIEEELNKIFYDNMEYDFDELLTSVGLVKHGEA